MHVHPAKVCLLGVALGVCVPTAADAQQEVEEIRIWGERADKPFDRGTELRYTGQELVRLGVTDLGQALELIPEINIRNVARGGRQIDVRGARKASVKILVDGIPVSDPYRGNVDVSSIPVTDIVQVRVSLAPASPIDGVGGPGGVVEIHTRDAIGARLLMARVQGSTLGRGQAAATGNTMLGESWAVRLSATGDIGAHDLPYVVDGTEGTVDEDRLGAGTAVRVEHRDGARRVVADLSMSTGHYLVPSQRGPDQHPHPRRRGGFGASGRHGGEQAVVLEAAGPSVRRQRAQAHHVVP